MAEGEPVQKEKIVYTYPLVRVIIIFIKRFHNTYST